MAGKALILAQSRASSFLKSSFVPDASFGMGNSQALLINLAHWVCLNWSHSLMEPKQH